MFARPILTACLCLAAGMVPAETFEIRMLNRGDAGVMVYEPAFVRAAPGDTVRFVPTDSGHNAESIDGMLPEGVEAFRSRFNDPFELTVTEEGLYGVKCTPHYGMGMVALIQVGAPVNLDTAAEVTHRGKAKSRMAELIGMVD
ncbi:pseudoazurin [Pseudoponticoccus marisrubri]|uniref:Pseudoazurin n=1 Tax=Pseudoponticoccus marisrubri TaxID=1685382 RepID=A0A0W7WI79_9RHOB|nr:pseudoazurin [Pseudoponticoccus marisrubri]KUF10325.1 pseudoazurin [Pseudoponticoccus marisrubri]